MKDRSGRDKSRDVHEQHNGDLSAEIIGDYDLEYLCWDRFLVLEPAAIEEIPYPYFRDPSHYVGQGCREGDRYYLTDGVSVRTKVVSEKLVSLFNSYDLEMPPEAEVAIDLQSILPYVRKGMW